MPLCCCFNATSVKEKNPPFSSSEDDRTTTIDSDNSSELKKQYAISALEPSFCELLSALSMLRYASDFESRGYTRIDQVSQMSDKELSFLKPVQKRKFQHAVKEAKNKGDDQPEVVTQESNNKLKLSRKILDDVEMKDGDEFVEFYQPGVITPNGTESDNIFVQVSNGTCIGENTILSTTLSESESLRGSFTTVSSEQSLNTQSSDSSLITQSHQKRQSVKSSSSISDISSPSSPSSEENNSPSSSFVVESTATKKNDDNKEDEDSVLEMTEISICKIIQRIFELGAVENKCFSCVRQLTGTLNTLGNDLFRLKCLIVATLAFCHHAAHGAIKDSTKANEYWAEVDLEELTSLARGGCSDNEVDEDDEPLNFTCEGGLTLSSSVTDSIMGAQVCAQFLIGYMDCGGLGYEKNSTKARRPNIRSAVRWYLKAARMGHSFAQHEVAWSLFTGDEGVPEDKECSVQWDQRSAAQGNSNAQYALGTCYDNGEGVDHQDDTTAYNYYKLAAEQNHQLALFTLGQCYEYGSGTSENLEKALKYYTAAASLGNADGQEAMEELCRVIACDTPVAKCRAIYDRATHAVLREDVDKLLCVDVNGNVSPDGCLVPWKTVISNHKKANKEEQIEVAETIGHPLTMATAAVCYYYGYGVEESYEKAKILWSLVDVDYLTALTKQDEHNREGNNMEATMKQYACFLLGGMLIIGQGRAEEDDEEGAELLARAAAPCRVDGCYHPHGLAHAQYSSGACNFYQVGVDYEDRDLGIELYTKAAAQGHQDAIAELIRLKQPVPELRREVKVNLPPLKAVVSDQTVRKQLVDLDTLTVWLLKLLRRFDAMKKADDDDDKDDDQYQVIEQWHFISDGKIEGRVEGTAFEADVANCSTVGLRTADGSLFSLGTPHSSELAVLQDALHQISNVYKTLTNKNADDKDHEKSPKLGGDGQLPSLVIKAQNILTFHGTSPISVLSIAAVEPEFTLRRFSDEDIAAITLTQALQRGKSARSAKLRAENEARSAIVIQSYVRARQSIRNQQRKCLWVGFRAGVTTGDFQAFIDAIEACSKVIPADDHVLVRARQLSTVLLAEAQVRWLGFTVARGSSSSFMSGFTDSDDRSWCSLHWTPYIDIHGDWLNIDFPMGFLLNSEISGGGDKKMEDKVKLDPFFGDSLRYSQALYQYSLDTSTRQQSWRLHTGKGSFFFVLHVVGPKPSEQRRQCSGLSLTIRNPDAETSLVDALMDLNQNFDNNDNDDVLRKSKVLVFQFQVDGRQPAVSVTLDRYKTSDSENNNNNEEDGGGYVCGFEVVLDTSNDSLWWLNSEFYSQNSSNKEENNLDEHEVDMEKFRQASVRTAWETTGSKRQIKYSTKESILNIRRKTKKLETKLLSKHFSFNPTNRMLSCYEVNVLEPEWTRRVIGRAFNDVENSSLGFKISTCTSDSETRVKTMYLSVNSNTTDRDEWITFINSSSKDSLSSPKKSRNNRLRYSCDDLLGSDNGSNDVEDNSYRSQSMDTLERPRRNSSSGAASLSRTKSRRGSSRGTEGRRSVRSPPQSPTKPNDRKSARRSPPVKRPSPLSPRASASPSPTTMKKGLSRVNSAKRTSPVRRRSNQS